MGLLNFLGGGLKAVLKLRKDPLVKNQLEYRVLIVPIQQKNRWLDELKAPAEVRPLIAAAMDKASVWGGYAALDWVEARLGGK